MKEHLSHTATPSPAAASFSADFMDRDEATRLISDAYSKGRADVFAYLGLDEKDFPAGEGLAGWAA